MPAQAQPDFVARFDGAVVVLAFAAGLVVVAAVAMPAVLVFVRLRDLRARVQDLEKAVQRLAQRHGSEQAAAGASTAFPRKARTRGPGRRSKSFSDGQCRRP